MSKIRKTIKISKIVIMAIGLITIIVVVQSVFKRGDATPQASSGASENAVLASEGRTNVSRLMIAHRGASGYIAEHTFEAKAYAHALGADYLEQDVVLTKDNVPIVLHDIYVDDVTNVEQIFPGRIRRDGRYYAIDFTWAELQNLNVHERTDSNGKQVFPGRFPNQYPLFKLHTLEEEILFIKGMNKATGRNVGIYPEIKQPEFHESEGKDITAVVVEMLKMYQYDLQTDMIYLQSFNLESLERAKNEFGYDGKLIFLIEGGKAGAEFTTEKAVAKYATLVQGVGPSISTLINYNKETGTVEVSDFAKYLKANNLEIHPWTVRADSLPEWANSVEHLQDVLFNQVGVTGVFTDFVDISLKYTN